MSHLSTVSFSQHVAIMRCHVGRSVYCLLCCWSIWHSYSGESVGDQIERKLTQLNIPDPLLTFQTAAQRGDLDSCILETEQNSCQLPNTLSAVDEDAPSLFLILLPCLRPILGILFMQRGKHSKRGMGIRSLYEVGKGRFWIAAGVVIHLSTCYLSTKLIAFYFSDNGSDVRPRERFPVVERRDPNYERLRRRRRQRDWSTTGVDTSTARRRIKYRSIAFHHSSS